MDSGLYELMRVFARVAETGSFTAVAAESGQTQPTISRQIAALEAHLGRRLLSRSTRNLALTEDGRIFLAAAREALDAMDEAAGVLTEAGADVAGTVRIAASAAFARHNVIPRLGRLLGRYPRLKIDMVLADRFSDLVEDGIDLAIRIGALDDSNLVARRLGAISRITVATPDYWNRKGRPAHPRDLKMHDCVLYTSAQTRDAWAFETPDGPVSVKVSGPVRVNVSDAMREAVLAGLGVGLTPRSFWRDELALQLRFGFYVSALGCGLMGAPPERPCDDLSWIDLPLSEPGGYAADFLDGPADEPWRGELEAVFRLFGGGAALAWRRIAAIMAKASMTREAWRCQPCQERVSL